jgi:hypothetical protein
MNIKGLFGLFLGVSRKLKKEKKRKKIPLLRIVYINETRHAHIDETKDLRVL